MNYLSLCCIARNEGPYLEEWLRFYQLLGVEHFYFYDNASNDTTVQLLTPWIESGRVSYFNFPGRAAQESAYSHCLQNFRAHSVWLAFLDADEFLFSPLQTDLRVFLRDYEAAPAVVANWVMFGTSGHHSRPSGLVTLNYTQRAETGLCTLESAMLKDRTADRADPKNYWPVHAHVKSIVNTRDVIDISSSPHHFAYRPGRVPVTAWGEPVPGPFSNEIRFDQLRINHYYSRSSEELLTKLARGRADTGGHYNPREIIERIKFYEKVHDTTIFPLGLQVQALMQSSVV